MLFQLQIILTQNQKLMTAKQKMIAVLIKLFKKLKMKMTLVNLNPTEISLQDINNNSTLILGQSFPTFSSFQSTLNKYSKETFQIFSITDSKYSNNNKENSEPNDYKFAIFSCYKHLDTKDISKGNKQRGKQNYSGTNCKAYIRVVKKEVLMGNGV